MMDIMQSTADTIADEDRSALSALAAALRPWREMSDPGISMPISIVSTFAMVAMRPDRTVSEYAKSAGVSLTNMSRQLADLGDVNRRGAPGLGLVERRVELHDRRFMRHKLTPKGHALVRQIASALAPKSATH
jgi:DNA-binding MarR family transcriptional regulator